MDISHNLGVSILMGLESRLRLTDNRRRTLEVLIWISVNPNVIKVVP